MLGTYYVNYRFTDRIWCPQIVWLSLGIFKYVLLIQTLDKYKPSLAIRNIETITITVNHTNLVMWLCVCEPLGRGPGRPLVGRRVQHSSQDVARLLHYGRSLVRGDGTLGWLLRAVKQEDIVITRWVSDVCMYARRTCVVYSHGARSVEQVAGAPCADLATEQLPRQRAVRVVTPDQVRRLTLVVTWTHYKILYCTQ